MTETMHAPQTRKGLAIAALVLGIIAALSAIVPILGVIAGIVAIVLGAVALRRRQSKGLSITGIILGSLATIASAVVTVTVFALAGSFFAAVDQNTENAGTEDSVVREAMPSQEPVAGKSEGRVEDGEESDSGAAEEPGIDPFDTLIEWHAFDTADASPSAHAGTAEDPHPTGVRFEIDGWHVVVNLIDPDAEARLRALAPENPAPEEGKRYVLVHMTVNNPSEETLPVSWLSMHYDTPKQLYSARRGGVEMTPDPALVIDGDRLLVGNFSGYIAFQTDDVPGNALRISSALDREQAFIEAPVS